MSFDYEDEDDFTRSYLSNRQPKSFRIVQNRLLQIPADRSDDLYNLKYADTADLVLFMAGSQFMVMEALLAEFQKQFTEVKMIFNETLRF